jgi:hypothetical protein
VPEKLPFADPQASDQRSVNDIFDRMVKGLSPSRRIRGSPYSDKEHPEDQWHPIDHVHLAPGAPKENGLLTVREFIDVWHRLKQMKRPETYERRWHKYGLAYPSPRLGIDHDPEIARVMYERDLGQARAATWWRRFPDPFDILPQYREQAANLIWRQWVAELPWFEVSEQRMRPRPAALDHPRVCRVCATLIEQRKTGRPPRYCSPAHRQHREYERDRLVRAVMDLKRHLY